MSVRKGTLELNCRGIASYPKKVPTARCR